LAISSDDTAVVVALSPIIFVNQSMITTIVFLFFDFGSGSCYGTLWTLTIFILFYFIFQFYFSFS